MHLSGKLGRQSISAELLQPAELVSGVICQVAVEPELAALLANFLYSNEGAHSAMMYINDHPLLWWGRSWPPCSPNFRYPNEVDLKHLAACRNMAVIQRCAGHMLAVE